MHTVPRLVSPAAPIAVRGAVVCQAHGGGSPAVKAKAKERVARAQAGKHLAGLGIDPEDRDPHQELSKQLSLTAAVAERVQELVSELEEVHDAGEVHPLLRLWAEERDRVAKMAKMAVSAGVKGARRSGNRRAGEHDDRADSSHVQ